MKVYNETFETNGIDYTYEIVHFLDSKDIMIQLIDENGTTMPTDSYTVTRNTNSTVIIRFHNNPKNKSKFTILILKL